MVDREDDLVIGIRSSAILFGRADRGIIALLQAGALAGLVAVGRMTGMGRWYWAGLLVAAACTLYQHYLIRHRHPGDCFRAFLNNNLFGLAVFGGILLDYLFRR
jgi:4-hydroxybenzoate polyprenyltransferase